ncbi:hypothetical protein BT63DRAFT_428772 [Microthyrium microscopicum]|uniref:DUF218 domain-containing protein n=1 Tax=Microthyrium microscopicum TaxID=703497 RepID=A0A6A6U2E6_9PEZI|nr:hypothetical protein BT63DRAFT_428772 [Microthyrium microscopicum]
MPYILFILGSPNSPDGILSPTSENRITRAIEIQTKYPEMIIMATGGFGSHFNTSPTPHRELLHQCLLRNGAVIDAASPKDLLSSNTVEDATMILEFSSSHHVERFGVLTSKFHMTRCQFIFECLAGLDVVDLFTAADPPSLAPDVLEHETTALDSLKAQGCVIVEGVPYPHKKLPE